MKRGGDHIERKVHRAERLILALALQMRKVAIHPIDDVGSVICKAFRDLGTFLLRCGIGRPALSRILVRADSVVVPAIPLTHGELAVAVLVKSLLQTIEHRTYLLFSRTFYHAYCPKIWTI